MAAHGTHILLHARRTQYLCQPGHGLIRPPGRSVAFSHPRIGAFGKKTGMHAQSLGTAATACRASRGMPLSTPANEPLRLPQKASRRQTHIGHLSVSSKSEEYVTAGHVHKFTEPFRPMGMGDAEASAPSYS